MRVDRSDGRPGRPVGHQRMEAEWVEKLSGKDLHQTSTIAPSKLFGTTSTTQFGWLLTEIHLQGGSINPPLGGAVLITLPGTNMEVENTLFVEENGLPFGAMASTSMLVPGSVIAVVLGTNRDSALRLSLAVPRPSCSDQGC